MTFSVLFVCTGNICRSPAAERIFRARMDAGAGVQVASAGTYGLVGRGIDEPIAVALRDMGIEPSGHLARRIEPNDLNQFDLILTATAEHRGIVLRGAPRMMTRTFTMREFVRLAAGLDDPPIGDFRQQVRTIAGQRGQVALITGRRDDIADPFGATLDVARRCVQEISDAVDGVLRALGLATVPPGR